MHEVYGPNIFRKRFSATMVWDWKQKATAYCSIRTCREYVTQKNFRSLSKGPWIKHTEANKKGVVIVE